MKIHNLAKYFPLLEGEEFDLLVKDIEKHGQLEPIVMVGDEILDGVNRWRACEQLGLGPKTIDYTGTDPLNYVVSMNVRRRHLTESQKAMLATNMLPEFETQAEKRRIEARKTSRLNGGDERDYKEEHERESATQAAKQFGVSRPTIQRAKRVAEQAPERIDNIVKGKETVRGVDQELREEKEKERKKTAQAATLIEMRGDEIIYRNKLLQAINIIPTKPPKELTEKGYQELNGLWQIILNRGKEFNNGKNESLPAE